MLEIVDDALLEMCDLRMLKNTADHKPNACFDMDGIQYQLRVQTAYEHHKRFGMGTNITSEDIAAMESEIPWWLFITLDKEHNPVSAYLANKDILSGWFEKQKRKLALGTRVYAGTDLWDKACELLEQNFDEGDMRKLNRSFFRSSYSEDANLTLEYLTSHCFELRPDDIGKDLRKQIGSVLKLQRKVCLGCNKEFGISNFHKQKVSQDGHESKCKTCRFEKNKENMQDPDYREKVRQRSQEYRDNMAGAIYCIKNTATDKCYVGKSKNYITRKGEHASRLRKGKHENPRLQEDWTKFGEDAFEFSVLEEMPAQCDDSILFDREAYHMQDFVNKGIKLYNIDRRCLLK
jgi:hypothetical protein